MRRAAADVPTAHRSLVGLVDVNRDGDAASLARLQRADTDDLARDFLASIVAYRDDY